LDRKLITRMVIAGALVGVVGIALFLGLWVLLGTIVESSFARVVLSICLPPIILATVFGMYYLVVRPGSNPSAGSGTNTLTSGGPAESPTNTPSDTSVGR
jgi:uncharacterized RDD family membrane protein YckC